MRIRFFLSMLMLLLAQRGVRAQNSDLAFQANDFRLMIVLLKEGSAVRKGWVTDESTQSRFYATSDEGSANGV